MCLIRHWSCGAVERERTLAMIKPDGLSGNYTEKIKEAVLESGFDIVIEAVVRLDTKRASLFYAEHSERSFYDSLVKYIMRYSVQKTFLMYHKSFTHCML
jgi:nucleoside diphosphate kinase homolog 5